MMKKYAEEIETRYHYADWRGRLLLKALCDLFNDVANAQTLELGLMWQMRRPWNWDLMSRR